MSNNHLINQNLDKHLFKNIFVSLINENKWDTLIEIFSLGIVDINIKDDRGRNSLFWAIHKNKIDVIKKLISFNINTKDFGLHINHFTSEEDEYLESLEITNIIKKDQ